MSAPIKKRRKVGNASTEDFPVKFPNILLFIVDRKMPKVRHEHLKKLARIKGIPVADKLGNNVTHIVAEVTTRDQVLEILQKHNKNININHLEENAEILSIDWFTTSMEENKPADITDKFRLPRLQKETTATKEEDNFVYEDTKYACQRKTPLNHFNKKLTDALEVLEKHADLTGGEQDYSRALAFRRASASLKSFPRTITSMKDVANMHDVGRHCKEVIKEILEDGYSTEIEDIKSSEWFKTMKLFTGVYGCGPVTARKWYDMGCRTLSDVIKSDKIPLNRDQKHGIKYYDDLQIPVTKSEAEAIKTVILKEVNQIMEDLSVVITGGFIRGKPSGHDADFLISHPIEGKERGLLPKLLSRLNDKNLLLYCNVQANSFKEESFKSPKHYKSSMLDQFEKCLSIFKLEKPGTHETVKTASVTSGNEADQGHGDSDEGNDDTVNPGQDDNDDEDDDSLVLPKDRNWKAVRVDFVVCPSSQYAYALMGWTGSRMFNRSVRLYADRELGMTLTSHGLFHKSTMKFLPAQSEQEIFDHLKLTYLEPWERNC
ncbi:DNA nucleotidylexotransferase-like [Glandiceps talaboti]